MEEKKDIVKEFTEIYTNKIKREGADKLLDWLLKSDFITCPASTKFHSNYEGGLIEHSIKAYKRFVKNLEKEYGENWKNTISEESAAIIGLLHDICKVGYYKQEMRNVKEDGVWVQKPYYTVDDKLPYGHGEKSVYIISGFMKLTREEAMAINWHMGGFDTRVQGGSYSISTAFYEFPTALIFHLSDLEATYLDERINN
ncbi:MAG: hydrolase [Firmicutes bacterium]|nr:hydrolase [Bacillota bacterium]